MEYNNYKKSRNLSWEILIRERITTLPIKVSVLCKQMNINLRYGDTGENNDGYSTIINGAMYIVAKENMLPERTRFTIAHEIGHILLGHVGCNALVNREPSPTDNPIEQEANVFASRLLAPACVLWGCGVKTAADIAKLCDISQQAAEFRMKRMEELYKRNKFLTSTLEQTVYNQFKPFINSHRL